MKRMFTTAFTLTLGLLPASGVRADHEKPLSAGTPVTLVGVISSQPRNSGFAVEEKFQVAVGPDHTDHTLHVNDALMYDTLGNRIYVSDLRDKWWVKADGTLMKDPRRVKVTRLTLISRDPNGFRQSAFFRPGMDSGYVETVAGERQVLTTTKPFRRGERVLVIGEITSEPLATEKKMQVAVGSDRVDYTLHFGDGKTYGMDGKTIDAGAFDNKQWVVAEGTVMKDGRRIKADRVQVVGRDWNGYQGSTWYRTNWERGIITNDYDRTAIWPAASAGVGSGFSQGTSVVVVGEVTSDPKGTEKKMQVGIGPSKTDYTLHLSDAQLYGYHGEKVDEDHFDEKMWVRAEGQVMDDPRRIKITRLQVIGKDLPGLQRSAFYRPGFDQGYVMTVAGTRQFFPAANTSAFSGAPMTIVGKVSDDTDPLRTSRKIQVNSAGNEWTLNVTDNATVVDAKGEKISIHEVDEGQWVRATGWMTDDLRLRVIRVENLGADEAFRASQTFRTEWPLGYVERVAGSTAELNAIQLTGTVIAIHPERGYFVVRDASQRDHWVYFDSAAVTVTSRQSSDSAVRVGDRVSVNGRIVSPVP